MPKLNVPLIECSWEVCNQIGGIYTVLRSKVPAMVEHYGDDYTLLGPLVAKGIDAELEDIKDADDAIARAVEVLQKDGVEIRYARWLVTGRPKVVLIKPDSGAENLALYQEHYRKNYQLEKDPKNDLLNEMIVWSRLNYRFLEALDKELGSGSKMIAHFHEWMASLPILDLHKNHPDIRTVFTTHATLLGRYLASNYSSFYKGLPKYDWEKEARHFGILPMVQIERLSAQFSNCFSTVSDITAKECKYLLGKDPEVITPNGLNIKRYVAMHEVQVKHQEFKEVLHDFTIGHFFPSYHFDLDKTLYFFTSGRYEFSNKGYDVSLRALALLNERMKQEKLDVTVVMFFVTNKETWSINPKVLQSNGVLREIRKCVGEIQKQIGKRLYESAVGSDDDHRLPDTSAMVDDYWKLRYRRTIQSWKSDEWPYITTHNLKDDQNDDILNEMRAKKLFNSPKDKVKVVYHPEFINSTNPLFGIDYGNFVRGCHLGIFPSYYEPWGYTPLECIARGVATVTSDLSGFGNYVSAQDTGGVDHGVHVLRREGRTESQAIEDLANYLLDFVKLSRRYRIIQRNRAEDFSERFDWKQLLPEYEKAYQKALA
ncbi:glycosyltransferase [Croceimicrobium sp.]|uniref:glycosyltransferase n=1 Tax=Croceimicrobium sp. TaxID=2828340 RepID=UPI003BA91BE4